MWDSTKGMRASDQHQDDINTPVLLHDEPPIAEWAVQHPPGLPRPPRQRPHIHPNLHPVHPASQEAHEEEQHGTTRQSLHSVTAHHVALKHETLQLYVCVPEEDELHTIAYPIVQT